MPIADRTRVIDLSASDPPRPTCERETLEQLLEQFKLADEERLQETHRERDEAERWRADDDMYGWNFYMGKSSGTIGASLYYGRVRRAIEKRLAELGNLKVLEG